MIRAFQRNKVELATIMAVNTDTTERTTDTIEPDTDTTAPVTPTTESVIVTAKPATMAPGHAVQILNPAEELGNAPLGSTTRDRTDMQRMGKIQELKVWCFLEGKQ